MTNPFQSQNIRNILVIQLGDIGDVVLSFPAVRALREHFPDAGIWVAVREKAKELIEDCPWVSGAISVDNKKSSIGREIIHQIAFFSSLRKRHFDLAIDLRTGDRGAILAFLSGAPQRISYYEEDGTLWRNRVFTHLFQREYRIGQYVAEYYSSILGAYGISTPHILPEMVIPDEKRKAVQRLFEKEKIPLNIPVVALQPFSLWQYKEWAADKYIRLIQWIQSEHGLPVILTGSKEERKRAEKITDRCGPSVYNLAGKTSIGMFAAIVNACGLFIGVDSAGIHIAAAVGTPTVSIFGPSAPASWAPIGPEHRIVQKRLPCVPCRLKGCGGKEKSRCLEELTVDEVLEVVNVQIENWLKWNRKSEK